MANMLGIWENGGRTVSAWTGRIHFLRNYSLNKTQEATRPVQAGPCFRKYRKGQENLPTSMNGAQ
jgi:hypothetical protein